MNKKVLITGSTRGIGKAIAEKFHSQNWDVVVTARDHKQVNQIVSDFNSNRKNSALGFIVDLAVLNDIKLLSEQIKKQWAFLDCIVFNVGSGSGIKGLSATLEHNERLFRTNFLDVVKTYQGLLPLVKNQLDAGLIFIGSIAQEINVNAPLSYSYAKRALHNFVKSQAIELAPHKISVNLINPGHILTKEGVWERKMVESKGEFTSFISDRIPLGRMGQPEEVADLAFAVANNDISKYVTGASLTIDGGATLRF